MSVKLPTVQWLRLAAVVLFVLSIGAAVLDLLALGELRRTHPETTDWITQAAAPGVVALLIGAAGACVLLGISQVLSSLASLATQLRAERGGPMTPEISTRALDQLSEAVEALTRQMRSGATDTGASHAPDAAGLPPASTLNERLLERAVFLLEELRETSLLNETQRAERLSQLVHRRKHAALLDVSRLLQQGQWAKAEHLLSALEKQHPGEPDVVDARSALEVSRGAVERQTLADTRARAEDLMAVGSWDQALEMVQSLVDNFPSNADARVMLARVSRERDLFRESTVQRLYEEAKYELERRNWRRALGAVQKLTERYPDHSKTNKLRPQFRTIQDNAEIEERQETESRIRELVQAKRFADAIALSEDLLRRFPKSPQADAISELLPKMRELAVQHEAGAIR